MKCKTCGSTQGTITELVVIDSFSAMVEEGSFTQGYSKWWCEICHGSIRVLTAEMDTWWKERKERLRQ